MENFALIFICLLAGMIIARLNIIPKDSFKGINAWLLYVALPALALRYVPEIDWNFSAILPSIAPPIVWIGAFIFVTIYSKFTNLTKETKSVLLITTGLCNSAFLCFPLIAAFYGEHCIKYAIVYDQITFIMFSTVVVSLVMRTKNNQQISILFLTKKMLLFPSLLATLFTLIFSNFLDFSFLNPLLDKILFTLSPLALFSIGLQIRFSEWRLEFKNLLFGLTYKLFIAPFLILLLALLMKETSLFANITIFEASMSSHITSSLLASQYDLNPRLCGLMVGIGIVINFFSSTFWYFIGNYFTG